MALYCSTGFSSFIKQSFVFMALEMKALKNIVRKGENAGNQRIIIILNTFCHLQIL